MAAKTGSSYTYGTMTDGIRIPTTNSGFSMMTSSKCSQMISTTNDYQKLQAWARNVYVFIFGCRSLLLSLGFSFVELGVAANPTFAVGIVILPVMVQEI